MNLLYRCILAFSALSVFLTGCNLEKQIEVPLPNYNSQPVVECYLEPGKNFRLLLTQSYAYFDTLLFNQPQKILINDAQVTISYAGNSIQLSNGLFAEPTGQFYNYQSDQKVPELYDSPFELLITLKDGKKIHSTTTISSKIPLDSTVVEWKIDQDTSARLLTYFSDDPAKEDYYRHILSQADTDSTLQDFVTEDFFFNQPSVVFGTLYRFETGDTVITDVIHINKDYYRYLNSVFLAWQTNLNPFSQPGLIESNVSGTANPLGIFTGFFISRDSVIIKY